MDTSPLFSLSPQITFLYLFHTNPSIHETGKGGKEIDRQNTAELKSLPGGLKFLKAKCTEKLPSSASCEEKKVHIAKSL